MHPKTPIPHCCHLPLYCFFCFNGLCLLDCIVLFFNKLKNTGTNASQQQFSSSVAYLSLVLYVLGSELCSALSLPSSVLVCLW